MGASFEELVAQAEAAPISGWDFSWLDGRATEERPPWRYSELVAARTSGVASMLDLESGGGEMIAGLPELPPLFVATEGYPPNVDLLAARLRPRRAFVVATDDPHGGLPFAPNTFELVTSRHPVTVWWDEIARVLGPGGSYLSQQVGPGSVHEVTDFLMGPQPIGPKREPRVARAGAEAAGLEVVDLREARLRTVFNDVGAVVYFLRLVVWIVPGFTVSSYRARLEDLHEQIQRDGPFVAHATRFLVEARKPR